LTIFLTDLPPLFSTQVFILKGEPRIMGTDPDHVPLTEFIQVQSSYGLVQRGRDSSPIWNGEDHQLKRAVECLDQAAPAACVSAES
jgi:hypothetical protein